MEEFIQFYKHQPSQHGPIRQIHQWLLSLVQQQQEQPEQPEESGESTITNVTTTNVTTKTKKPTKKQLLKDKVKTAALVVLADTGAGKTFMVNAFLQHYIADTFDILDIGKLLDIYEHTNIYSLKDFIPKILKQKQVTNVSGGKKLLLIDSLEEFFSIQKTILRDVIDSVDSLQMPVVIVCGRIPFDNLEKKMLAKLTKEATIVTLEPPNQATLLMYVREHLGYKAASENEEETLKVLLSQSNGDLRHVRNMLMCCPSAQHQYNGKDYILDIEKAILTKFSRGNISDIFNYCATEPFIYGMLTYENYIHCTVKKHYDEKDEKDEKVVIDKKNIIDSICEADHLEKKLFKFQQWDLLETYAFLSTIYPWRLMEPPKALLSSSTLQKFMNTKKKHRKCVFDF